MTGRYDIYRAAFRQSGIIEIFDIDDLADACRAFLGGVLPAGPRVASVGISGGAGILFTDRAIARGLTLAKLGEDTNNAPARGHSVLRFDRQSGRCDCIGVQ